jgi:hypothetical protein
MSRGNAICINASRTKGISKIAIQNIVTWTNVAALESEINPYPVKYSRPQQQQG